MDADDRRHNHTPDPGRITVNLADADDDRDQNHSSSSKHSSAGGGGGPGGGREDCWSDAATSILIDAWGERYQALSRGNLKQTHWKEVADIVCASLEKQGQVPKTDVQCKNRIDTVKKKYKLEKSKMLAGGAPSRWPFFRKLDRLIGPAPKDPTPLMTVLPPPVVTRSSSHKMQPPPAPADSDSTGSEREESYAKRRRMSKETSLISNTKLNSNCKKGQQGGVQKKLEMSSMGDLTKAILNMGQAYEQAENAKLKQLMEIEKHRMKFAKDLELQRMQLFMKTQVEISKMKEAAIRRRRGKNKYHNHSNNHNNINHSNANHDREIS